MKKTTIKKKVLTKKWIIVGIIILVLVGIKYVSSTGRKGEQRAAMEAQQQVMVDHWQDQGLSDEEIQEELETYRLEQRGSADGRSEPSFLKKMLGGKRGGR